MFQWDDGRGKEEPYTTGESTLLGTSRCRRCRSHWGVTLTAVHVTCPVVLLTRVMTVGEEMLRGDSVCRDASTLYRSSAAKSVTSLSFTSTEAKNRHTLQHSRTRRQHGQTPTIVHSHHQRRKRKKSFRGRHRSSIGPTRGFSKMTSSRAL